MIYKIMEWILKLKCKNNTGSDHLAFKYTADV